MFLSYVLRGNFFFGVADNSLLGVTSLFCSGASETLVFPKCGGGPLFQFPTGVADFRFLSAAGNIMLFLHASLHSGGGGGREGRRGGRGEARGHGADLTQGILDRQRNVLDRAKRWSGSIGKGRVYFRFVVKCAR